MAHKPGPQIQTLNQDAEQALLDGALEGIVAVVYENERPLRGLAGVLDWRFQGAISSALKSGAISGSSGECAYLPIQKHSRTYHLFLVGGGFLDRYAKRGYVSESALKRLALNLRGLKMLKVGISRSDLGGITDELIKHNLPEVPVWIVQ